MATQLESLIQNVPTDPQARKELHEAAKKLLIATETEPEMRWDMHNNAAVPTIITQVAVNLGLIDDLVADTDKVWSVAELSSKYNANPSILTRLLRMLSAYGFIAQMSKDTYTANARTQRMSTPASKNNIQWYNACVKTAVHALPDHLNETKYQSSRNAEGLAAINRGFDTKESPFAYMFQHPHLAKAMLGYMATYRDGLPGPWDGNIDLSEFKLTAAEVDDGRVVFVDVGGGSGHQAIQFRQKQPQLKGKVVVEDLPHQIEQIDAGQLATLDIDALAHDFTVPQPVKNAKVYYMRSVLHDWPDEQCLIILSRLRDAMADDSMIVIDEVVVPSMHGSEIAAALDLVMMSIGSVERSEDEWHALVDAAGLRIKAVRVYDQEAPYALTIACKA